MSFDLAFWPVVRPITSAEAASHFSAVVESDEPASLPDAARMFLEDLERRWPPLEQLSDDDGDGSPWSMSPQATGDVVIVTMRYSRAHDLYEALVGLAHEHDLLVFDPQRDQALLPPNLGSSSVLSVQTEAGRFVEGPTAEELGSMVASLHTGDSYLILTRTHQRYMQTQVDDHGRYAVEYRDGGPAAHFRTDGLDLDMTRRLFALYVANDRSWIDTVAWRKLDFS